MFFKDSVRGLQPARRWSSAVSVWAPSAKCRSYSGLKQRLNDDYRIPVEVRVEPQRLINQLGGDPNIRAHIDDLINRGLRGSLKPVTVTGALYRSRLLSEGAPRGKIQEFNGYPIIPTISGGLAQIQQRRWMRWIR